jgi:hypothetical protein
METFIFNGEIDWEEVIKTIVLFALIGFPIYSFIHAFINGYRGESK